ncbi:MAG: secretin N-terminal domain-containing protein [Planctomycetota bacterium]
MTRFSLNQFDLSILKKSCIAAVTTGCLLVSSASAQQHNSTLDRLLNSKGLGQSTTLPDSSFSKSHQRPASMPNRDVTPVERPAFIGPSAGEFLGNVRQAESLGRSAAARVVMDNQPVRETVTWQTPNTNMRSPDSQGTVIQRASFQLPAVENPASRGNQFVSTDQPARTTLSKVYQLSSVALAEFEARVIDLWGNRLTTTASDNGRYVEVTMPATHGYSMKMTIDRRLKSATYTGDSHLLENWRLIMKVLDSNPRMLGDGRIVHSAYVVSDRVSPGSVQKVAFMMGLAQDQDEPATLQLPPGVEPTAQDLQDAQLSGKVKIMQDPETGNLTLAGDPEDIRKIKEVIDRLNEQAIKGLPKSTTIQLENLQAEAVVEQIQLAYDNQVSPLVGPAQIIPVPNSNSLLVLASPEGIQAVREIVSSMDMAEDITDLQGFKVFELKHIAAIDARDRLLTLFSQSNLQGGDNNLPSVPATVVADFRSNTLTVRGSKRNIEEAEAYLAKIDIQNPADLDGARTIVRVFPLKNALAEDLQLIVQDAINGQLPNAGNGFNPNQQAQNQNQQNQNQQSNPDSATLKSSPLTLQSGVDGRDVDGGFMFDVRVSADRNSNSLVVRGPADAMKFIAELISQLDRAPNAQTELKVFEIVNGDAQLLLDMLEQIFGSDQTQLGGGNQQGGANTLNQLPLQGVATDGQTLVNLRFALDFRRNAIVATGSARDLQTVEDLLNRLDAADIQRNETIVYRLSNAPALDIADALTQWVETRQDIITTDPRTNSDVLATNRAINIVPEVVSNSLIVTARPEYKAEIEGIIKALDRRPPMVKVKVLIAEVSLTALEEFGVELGVQDSLLFDRGTIVGANNQITGGIGFPFNQSNAANSNATFSNTLAGQALSNLGLGRINTELGYGGLVLSGGSESVSVLVRALRDRQCVRVLSKPHIMTLENLQGRVSIGAEVPRVSGTSQTNFGVTQDINFVDVGVILEVTPRVSPDGLIVMAVNAQRSRVGGDETGITIGFGANGDPIIAPQIIETEANTTLMARSGQTVVFSGLIQEDKRHAERGAPFLSDLPVIGPLFKFEADSSERTELLIIMTPYLVTDEADIALLNQDEADRMHWCECDVAEIYGTSESTSHWNTEAATEIYRPVADPTGMQPIQHDIQVDPQIQVPLGKNESTKKPGVRTANFLESKKRR